MSVFDACKNILIEPSAVDLRTGICVFKAESKKQALGIANLLQLSTGLARIATAHDQTMYEKSLTDFSWDEAEETARFKLPVKGQLMPLAMQAKLGELKNILMGGLNSSDPAVYKIDGGEHSMLAITFPDESKFALGNMLFGAYIRAAGFTGTDITSDVIPMPKGLAAKEGSMGVPKRSILISFNTAAMIQSKPGRQHVTYAIAIYSTKETSCLSLKPAKAF